MTPKPTAGLFVPSLSDALYSAVREEIFEGRLAGGDFLTEVGLAERFGVARPTAKAAVERLVHDGLLQRSQNKSARIPILDAEDVRELYWTRKLLEREIFRELAQRQYISAVARRHVQDLQLQVDQPVLTAVLEADIGFHRALVAQLENPRLLRLYDSVMGEMHLCMAQVQLHRLLDVGRIVEEHQSMVDAIEASDEDRAVAEICEHLDRARDRLVAYLEHEGSDAAAPALSEGPYAAGGPAQDANEPALAGDETTRGARPAPQREPKSSKTQRSVIPQQPHGQPP